MTSTLDVYGGFAAVLPAPIAVVLLLLLCGKSRRAVAQTAPAEGADPKRGRKKGPKSPVLPSVSGSARGRRGPHTPSGRDRSNTGFEKVHRDDLSSCRDSECSGSMCVSGCEPKPGPSPRERDVVEPVSERKTTIERTKTTMDEQPLAPEAVPAAADTNDKGSPEAAVPEPDQEDVSPRKKRRKKSKKSKKRRKKHKKSPKHRKHKRKREDAPAPAQVLPAFLPLVSPAAPTTPADGKMPAGMSPVQNVTQYDNLYPQYLTPRKPPKPPRQERDYGQWRQKGDATVPNTEEAVQVSNDEFVVGVNPNKMRRFIDNKGPTLLTGVLADEIVPAVGDVVTPNPSPVVPLNEHDTLAPTQEVAPSCATGVLCTDLSVADTQVELPPESPPFLPKAKTPVPRSSSKPQSAPVALGTDPTQVSDPTVHTALLNTDLSLSRTQAELPPPPPRPSQPTQLSCNLTSHTTQQSTLHIPSLTTADWTTNHPTLEFTQRPSAMDISTDMSSTVTRTPTTKASKEEERRTNRRSVLEAPQLSSVTQADIKLADTQTDTRAPVSPAVKVPLGVERTQVPSTSAEATQVPSEDLLKPAKLNMPLSPGGIATTGVKTAEPIPGVVPAYKVPQTLSDVKSDWQTSSKKITAVEVKEVDRKRRVEEELRLETLRRREHMEELEKRQRTESLRRRKEAAFRKDKHFDAEKERVRRLRANAPKPRVLPKTSYEKAIESGQIKRGRLDYPTMSDIVSDWDSEGTDATGKPKAKTTKPAAPPHKAKSLMAMSAKTAKDTISKPDR